MLKLFFKVLTTLGVLIMGLLIVAQDQDLPRVASPVGAGDARFPHFVSSLTGAAVTTGNQYEILANGDRMFPSMLEAIRGAKRRISFETYIYDKGEVAGRFTDALEAAAKRGVQVNLVVDAFGCQQMPQEHIERLRKAGGLIGIFNPFHWYMLEELNYRTHRKILVIDGEAGFTGGAGVADHWLGNAQDAEHWRDTQIKVTGPAVRYLEGAFYENLSTA